MNKNKRISLFVVMLIGMFFFSGKGAGAVTTTFDVTQDTFINEAYPDNNYGSTGSIVVSNVPIDRYGFLQFDDVSIPEDAVVDSVNLEFYVYDHSHNDDAWLRIGLIGGSAWEEDEPKWDGPYPGPLMSAGNFNDVNLDLSAGWKEVDVTELVGKWLSGEKDQRGIYIYPNASNDFTLSLRAKEHGSNFAALEVEYHIEEVEEYDFDLVSPEDDDALELTRPTFEWTEIDDDSDVDDYLLTVIILDDDGDDDEEVVSEKISDDDTEYKLEKNLEEGEYRWYVSALDSDENLIHETGDWEFSVQLVEEEEEEETGDEGIDEEEIDNDDEGDATPTNDQAVGFFETDESSLNGKDETQKDDKKEEGSSGFYNFLFLILGVGLAVLGYLVFQEVKERKLKKGKQEKGDKKNKKSSGEQQQD